MGSTREWTQPFADVLSFYTERQPEQVALRYFAQDHHEPQITRYGELARRARAIAGALQERLGRRRGERCVLMLPTGTDYAAAFFGCLSAGVIAVPAFPPEHNRQTHLKRLAGMLRDAKPKLVLGERACIERCRAQLQPLLPEDGLLLAIEEIDGSWEDAFQAQPVADHYPIFLQYTSGSTSVPKGVMVSDANLQANLRAMVCNFEVGASENWVSWLPLYHDMGLMAGLLLPLSRGDTLNLMAPNFFFARPARWLEVISRYGGSFSGGPDFAYRLCAERVPDSALEQLRLESWSVAFSGSEPVRADTLEAFCARFAPVGFRRQALAPAYGLAEATLYVSSCPRQDEFQVRSFDSKALNVGPAIQGGNLTACGRIATEHSLRIVDPQTRQSVPDGQVGEIWLAGPSLAQGYWQNPAATAEVFIEREGERWLRTGDLGICQDGELYIAGRSKDLIILNGQNLYPQDIEQVLEQDVELLRQGRIAAFAVTHEVGGEGIGLALEISRNVRKLVGPQLICERVRDAVATAFQVAPRLILLLQPGALPRTTSGKLQRSVCRDGRLDAFAVWRDGRLLDGEDRADAASAEPPLLDAVVAAWREVLDVAVLRAEDHFFALGGDSVRAVQVLARLNGELGLGLEPAALFERPRLGEFSAWVAQQPRAAARLALTPQPRGGELPQSFAQQRLWFLSRLQADSSAYHLCGELRLIGRLDERALQRSFDGLVARHETLRTVFTENEQGLPVQRIQPAQPVTIGQVDLTNEADAEARLQVLTREAVERPIDLQQGPLWRLVRVRMAGEEHRLLLVMHHIIADGWSVQVLLDDFAALYTAHVEGREPRLPALPVQYADYACWQRGYLAQGEGARQLAYWRACLGEEQPLLELPADRPRPARQSHRGARHTFAFGSELSARLRILARTRGVTLFMLLLAVFKVLLHRYSGQRDLRVGVPVAGRTRSETEGLIGFFINTQVLRIELAGEQTFTAVLEAVKAAALGAQARQELPFEQLVEALAPERSLSHNPLFQVKFIQQFPLPKRLQLPELSVSVRQLDDYAAHFDLSLDVTDLAGGIEGVFTYACDLFDPPRIEGFAADLVQLAAQLAARPDTRLGSLRLAAAPAVLLGETRDFPARDLLALWRDSLIRAGDTIALCYEDERYGYPWLEAESNRLAHRLHQLGIDNEDRVGLRLERSPAFVVGLLAILKAGGAFVPLDPSWPAERQAFVLADSTARVLLCQSAAPAGFAGKALDLTADADLRAQSAAPLDMRVLPGQLAYLIYTSGTSGQPKGVAVSHGALADYVQGLLHELRLAPGASMAMASSVAADLGHTALFGALCSARSLHLLAPERVLEADRFADYMAAHQVGILKIVPTHLAGLLQAAQPERVLPAHALILGGDSLPAELVAQVMRLRPQCRVINHYGPTEASVGVLTCEAQDETRGVVPIGRPLPNVRALVLGEGLEPVPQGAVGELYLGGPGLARGYLDRPDLTAANFLPDPGRPGARLYRSGDRARLLADGRIEFLGRADDQLKLRGYRIAPGEITHRLCALAGVRDAHVQLDGRGQLVAYVLATEGAPPRPDDLKAQLAEGLPDYMVPAHILCLERFPLTPNGKLDRGALPVPQPLGREYVAPQTGVEAELAELWQALLGVERVGRHDNFFELGGDSILSLQVIARARRLGIRLTPKQLFEHQSVAELARVAVFADTGAAAQPAPELARDFPLTPIQARFFAQAIARRAHWNQSLLLELRYPLEPVLLARALDAVLAQHDSLRLAFRQDPDSGWRQRYRAAASFDPVLWVREVAREEELPALFEQAQRSLDLERGPLLRAVQAHLPRGQSRLLLVAHHLVVDGVSWRILLEDLQRAYAQLAAGGSVDLGAKGASFQQWAERLQAWAEEGWFAGELPHWQAFTAEQAALPCDDPQGSARSGDGERLLLCLDREQTRRLLAEAPAAYRLRVDELLLAALAQALGQWSGRRRTMITLEGHGREDSTGGLDLSHTIGWFTSLFPLALEAGDTPAATLKAVKEALRAVPGKGLGYGVLKYLAGAALPELTGTGLTFNYLGRFDDTPDGAFILSAGDTGTPRDPAGPLANALVVDSQVLRGELRLSWTYSRARFSRQRIKMLLTLYHEALLDLIEHCCQPDSGGVTPADFPLAGLSQAQLDALPFPPREIEDILPLAPMQQGILLHSLLERGSGIYLMQDQYAVASELDFDAFQYAWEQVVQRHPMLRTGFHGLESGAYCQVVLCRVPPPAEFLDLSGLPRAVAETELDALLRRERETGFDFARPPLLRLRLVKFGAADYRIVQSHHHALIDAWCRGLMLAEFFAHYRARRAGHSLALPPARPYRDFITWLVRQDEAAGRCYWREILAGFAAPTPLPYRHSPQGEARMCDVVLPLGEEQTRRLQAQARCHQLTANTFVQAAWALLLTRYAGLDEAVFGVTVAGRPTELDGIEEALGLFINTLPLRVRLPGARASALALLQALQAHNAEMRQHEHLALADIQLLADTPRGQPLFDSLFVFENVPLGAEVQQAVTEHCITALANRTHTNYPLTVVVLPGESLQLQLSFDARQFIEADMRVLLVHFRSLLLQLIETPQQPLSELRLLGAEERATLLGLGQGTMRPEWYARSYLQHFESRVAAHPEREVACCQGERLSYAGLNRLANCLGHGLIGAGVRLDQVVALYAPRSLSLLAMILGAFKAGGAYLALDERHPAARSARMLAGSAAPVLVTPRACLAQAQAILAELAQPPQLLVYEELLGQGDDANPGRYAGLDQLAYVIYTSGSTGEPKGVMVSQRGMLSNQLSKVPYLDLGEDDVIAQTAATGFDISVWQFLTAPLFGARVEIISDAVAHDPLRLLEQAVASRVTVLECVPAVIDGMLAAPARALTALRWLLPTGEALTRDLAERWFARYPHIPLVNAYGPAECADDVALHTLTALPPGHQGMSIGRPTDNNRLYVLDGELELAPRGVVGELYIGGEGVGRGYAGRPGLSAERFLPDPFGAPGARLYRSGDLVRWNARGELEYLGRSDFQVKIRGQRVELGEIEAGLLSHADVHQAVAVARPTPAGDQLVAYVVAQKGAAPAAKALKAQLEAQLPAFMVPAQIVFLERLPLNTNGKLDRKALPAPQWRERLFEAPRGELEIALAELWQTLLKVERVGRHDHFFELGGHSLLATRLLAQIREHLGVSVPLAQAFEATSVAAQAELIEALRDQALSDERLDALAQLVDELEEMG